MTRISSGKRVEAYNPSGLLTADFRELRPMQGDLKTLPDENKARLKASILKYGFRFPFFVWIDADGVKWINDGHQRERVLAELAEEGYVIPPLPYVEIEAATRKEAAELLLQANSRYGEYNPDTTFFADFDIDLSFLEQIEIPEFDVLLEPPVPEIIEDEPPESPAEPLTQRGEIWLCGRHRVMCGDATSKEDVERLVNGGRHEKMSLCLTDPPYSANYGTRKNEENITPQLASYLDSANAEELLRGFMSLLPTEFIVMTYTDKQLHPYVRVCDSLNFETIDLLIWEKQNFCFWPGARYQQQHELIFLTRKKGAKIISHVPSNQSTILYIDRKMNNDIHPTEKPLALWGLLLKYHSDSGALVYDPFLGSGTTLIACEQMDRICFGMEIVPYYIDVILDRYAKFTGGDPVRESDGKKWSELKHEPHGAPEDSARAARHDVE